jgi:hypothetical protein
MAIQKRANPIEMRHEMPINKGDIRKIMGTIISIGKYILAKIEPQKLSSW